MAVETDAYYVQSPLLYSFIEEVRRVMATEPDRTKTVQLLRPAFAVLLTDHTWLPDEFLQPDVAGGMGGGIGSYLIYRSTNGDLSLSSLVLPAGATTPVHDHLAWGLVGLYSGEQDEWVYRRLDPGGDEGIADLVEVERRHLRPGDFYELLPPEGDIHRVQASNTGPSVSLHLLGNDIGCVWRHRFEPELKRVQLFSSSYTNQPCSDEERARSTP
jgi:predicted metal-dependent enzyme (double-stranded beta helix superfamily)